MKKATIFGLSVFIVCWGDNPYTYNDNYQNKAVAQCLVKGEVPAVGTVAVASVPLT